MSVVLGDTAYESAARYQQIACALIAGLDAVVTRNTSDFAAAPILILAPATLVAQL
jgi:hypothetical protein